MSPILLSSAAPDYQTKFLSISYNKQYKDWINRNRSGSLPYHYYYSSTRHSRTTTRKTTRSVLALAVFKTPSSTRKLDLFPSPLELELELHSRSRELLRSNQGTVFWLCRGQKSLLVTRRSKKGPVWFGTGVSAHFLVYPLRQILPKYCRVK